jgi:Zn finger protein HypA/HybF involved in hydrogenase expression
MTVTTIEWRERNEWPQTPPGVTMARLACECAECGTEIAVQRRAALYECERCANTREE